MPFRPSVCPPFDHDRGKTRQIMRGRPNSRSLIFRRSQAFFPAVSAGGGGSSPSRGTLEKCWSEAPFALQTGRIGVLVAHN